MIFLSLYLLYVISGIIGYVYWYTKEDNICIKELLPLFALCIIFGTFIWIIFYFVCNGDKVIFRKR